MPALVASFPQIETYMRLASTNQRALAMPGKLPALVLCRDQVTGRGRVGRSWVSRPGCSVTFSIAYGLSGRLPLGLSLAAAVGAASALEELGYSVNLKWPNDLIGQDGKKIGGILVEVEKQKAAIGVGLNVNWFGELDAYPLASALAKKGENADIGQVTETMALGVLSWLEAWNNDGLDKVRDKWLSCTMHKRGDWIEVTCQNNKKMPMRYIELGDSGELVACDASGKVHKILSAEILL